MFVLSNLNNMKIIGNSALLVLVLAVLFTYSGCDNNGPTGPSVEEVQLDMLSGTWVVTKSGGTVATNVTLDAVSKKTDYSAFELTLSGTAGATSFSYSTVGRPALSAWPSTGDWKFGTSPESMIIRDPDTADALNVTYAVSGSQLQITFNFAKSGYSRTSQVTGEWIFTLEKK